MNYACIFRITGKRLCKFVIVIVEKSLNANFHFHFISCDVKYFCGSNIYLFHFTISTEVLAKSIIADWAKTENAKCCWGCGTTETLIYY